MPDQDKEEKPDCLFCKRPGCFIKSFGLRHDGVEYVATCPKGKAWDNACELTAEACHNVEERNKKQ